MNEFVYSMSSLTWFSTITMMMCIWIDTLTAFKYKVWLRLSLACIIVIIFSLIYLRN